MSISKSSSSGSGSGFFSSFLGAAFSSFLLSFLAAGALEATGPDETLLSPLLMT